MFNTKKYAKKLVNALSVISLFAIVNPVNSSDIVSKNNINDNENISVCASVHREETTPARILCLDGGGVKGVIVAKILEEIEERTGRKIYELFDVIAGTSAGGIITLGLTMPNPRDTDEAKYSARDLINIFKNEGMRIFPNSLSRKIMTLGGLLGAKHSGQGVRAVTREYFGDALISKSMTNVLVTAFDAKANKIKMFTNLAAENDRDEEYYMRDVATATSAAPVFLPAAKIKNIKGEEGVFIDGGVGANNPTALALSYARSLKLDVHNATIVSIGTGNPVKVNTSSDFDNAGLVNWGPRLIDVMFTANSSATHSAMESAYSSKNNGNYYRIQTVLREEDATMDDASPVHMEALLTSAKQTISNQSKTIDTICEELLTKLAQLEGSGDKKAIASSSTA